MGRKSSEASRAAARRTERERERKQALTRMAGKFGQDDVDKLAEFEAKVDTNDNEEMRRHVKKLEDLRKHEDPRLSFSTPEFREAQRIFTDNFKKNFGKPVEWAFVKKHEWSKPQL